MNRASRDPNRRPTHPGAVLRLDVLPELGLTQEELAKRLGVSRLTVSELLNEHRALSAAMAVRLERELGTRAEQWLAMQQALDLWNARRAVGDVAPKPLLLAPVYTGAAREATSAIRRAKAMAAGYTVSDALDETISIQQRGTAWTIQGQAA